MKANFADRNAAFVRRCCEIMKNTRQYQDSPRCLDDVVAEALESAPPCHFVSYGRAYTVMMRMRRGQSPGCMTRLRRKMWDEFRQQVESDLISHPRHRLTDAVGEVLNFSRPSRYFISHLEGRRILKAYLEKKQGRTVPGRIYSWRAKV